MTIGAHRHHRYTYTEHLVLEEGSSVRHEFLDGEIYAMAGGTPTHAALAASVNAFDNPAFGGPRPGYGAPGAVFGTIIGVLGFPRTLQLQARLAF